MSDLDELGDASGVVIYQCPFPSIEHVAFQVSQRIVQPSGSDRAQPHRQSSKPIGVILERSGLLRKAEPVSRHIDTRLSLAREPRGFDGNMVALEGDAMTLPRFGQACPGTRLQFRPRANRLHLIGDGFAALVDRPGRPTINLEASCSTSITLASTKPTDGA